MRNIKLFCWIILIILQVTFISLLLQSCSTHKSEKDRPNILLLMSDNQYSDHLGCYGDPVVKTPNIDQMAGQGVRFTNAYCAAPSCSPARNTLDCVSSKRRILNIVSYIFSTSSLSSCFRNLNKFKIFLRN